MPRYGLKRLYLLLLVPISIAALIFAAGNPQIVEELYSSGFYPIVAQALTSLVGIFPFSIAELLIVVGIIAFIALTVRSIKLAKNDLPRRYYHIYVYIANLLVTAALIFSSFVFFCGLNYYRQPFAEISGLEIKASSTEELTDVCLSLAEKANSVSIRLVAGPDGTTILPRNTFETAKDSVVAMKSVSKKYPFMRGLYSVPKPVVNSKLMTYAGILGVYCPFTFEANVNISVPDHQIPAAMCHELAHQRGFMREDEAQYIAYAACRTSGIPEFVYSGCLMALSEALYQLKDYDKAAYDRVLDTLSAQVRADYAKSNEYWNKYDSAITQVSTSINDAYLKANNQSDGVHGYGRMVDLLLADFRQK